MWCESHRCHSDHDRGTDLDATADQRLQGVSVSDSPLSLTNESVVYQQWGSTSLAKAETSPLFDTQATQSPSGENTPRLSKSRNLPSGDQLVTSTRLASPYHTSSVGLPSADLRRSVRFPPMLIHTSALPSRGTRRPHGLAQDQTVGPLTWLRARTAGVRAGVDRVGTSGADLCRLLRIQRTDPQENVDAASVDLFLEDKVAPVWQKPWKPMDAGALHRCCRTGCAPTRCDPEERTDSLRRL